ncbi:MAG: glycosyltransferase family 1 protein, partial [Candidatus Riflebacteria bacterium]|nr:glycosyltransferase family 1 protein [Candidatus Riflebacteria bacterium]
MPKKTLIAIISNNDDDVYCFRKELIDALFENNYNVLLSCPYGEKFELMKEYNWIYDNPNIDRRGTNIIEDFKLFVHYLKLFKKYKPDIVLTFTSKPNVYANISAQLLNIAYIPNVTGLGSVLKKSFLFQKFFMFLYKIAFRKANCIMFQNIQNYELAKKHYVVNSKYRLIPGSGVDISRFPLMDYPDGGDGINGETIVFNYIGRVLKEKGVDDFIETAKIIKN